MTDAKPHDEDELLAAYVDGVSELSPDERRRVEQTLAADPDARTHADATRALLGQLRELPPEGREPDWSALERAIGAAVGPTVPRPWWRSWRWLVPVGALAATAAAAVLVLHHPAPEHASLPAERLAVPEAQVPAVVPPPEAAAVWLDGEATDVGDGDPEARLDDLDRDAREALATDEPAEPGGILPIDDLGWVDTLDERAADRAEAWLATATRKKG